MARNQCPGMNPANFKPEDVHVHRCLSCHREMEFWKDDVALICPDCGHKTFNPNLGNTCLIWCKQAAACLGNEDVKEWIKRNRDKSPSGPANDTGSRHK